VIRKAVIPAAGFGTRFLPVTKAQPKEMLPIVDTPTIHYVVEEAVHSGIRDILLITGRGKQSIENYFDRAFELEANLQAQGRDELLLQVRRLSNLANIHFIRQAELRGLGDAVSHARWHVDDEPFLVLLGDTLVDAAVPCSRQLIDIYNRFKAPVIAVEQVPPDKVGRYGIMGGERVEENVYRIRELVEKPRPGQAPSDLAIGGRYVLTADVFPAIDRTPRGVGGEIQLTDALRLLLHEGREIYAYRFQGVRHDIGNRMDYLKTIVEYAAKRPDIGTEFRAFLEEFVAGLHE